MPVRIAPTDRLKNQGLDEARRFKMEESTLSSKLRLARLSATTSRAFCAVLQPSFGAAEAFSNICRRRFWEAEGLPFGAMLGRFLSQDSYGQMYIKCLDD